MSDGIRLAKRVAETVRVRAPTPSAISPAAGSASTAKSSTTRPRA
jgi:hypothetical protein